MGKYVIVLSLLLITMIGCSTSKHIDEIGTIKTFSILSDARSFIGTPYKYAGTSMKGMDCSGLVTIVYDRADIALPRTSANQSKQGREVRLGEAQPGDLVFFKKGGKVFHVGIISKVENDELWMIHSTSSKGVVEQAVLSNSYWRPKLHIIKRIG